MDEEPNNDIDQDLFNRDTRWTKGNTPAVPKSNTSKFGQRGSQLLAEDMTESSQFEEEESAFTSKLEEQRILEEVKAKFQNMKGILNKQGHVFKNWRTRYFEIKGEYLVYSQADANNFASTKKGQFSLKDSVVEEHSAIEGYENCFMVKTTSGKDYLLSAPTKETRQEWVDAIRYVGKGELPNYDFLHLSSRYYSTSAKLKGDRIYKVGWLERQGDGIRKNFRTSWFVLSSSRFTNSFVYYENPGDKIKSGEIPLKDSLPQRIEVKGKTNSFVIHTRVDKQIKAYIFCAKNQRDCDDWIEAIKAAVTALNEEQNYVDLFFNETDS